MSEVGERLTAAEVAVLTMDSSIIEVLVRGEDGWGNRLVCSVRPGIRTLLIGDFLNGYDEEGPVATLCGECHKVLLADAAGELPALEQEHQRGHSAVREIQELLGAEPQPTREGGAR